jgi:hypothetical protein
MTALNRGIVIGAVQVAMVLSLAGKMLIDRATMPRAWAHAVPYVPYGQNARMRGRYIALKLLSNDPRLQDQQVDYFIPKHADDPSQRPQGEELWVEVTVPPKGPPRPIRLGIKKSGVLTPLLLN